jgi:hypothetical protein
MILFSQRCFIKGGVAYTIETNYSINALNQKLAEKISRFFNSIHFRWFWKSNSNIVTVQEEDSEKIQEVLEENFRN